MRTGRSGEFARWRTPLNSIFEEQLGLGIVGGRLYRAEFEGAESARMAIRILRGEAATNLPPVIVGPIGSQYDWRELRRWKISEDRLPPGSLVKYRVPTLWDRYRAFVITGLALFGVQAALIAGLVVNLSRRRRAERSLRESEERMKLAADAAELGIWDWDFASNRVWMDDRSWERTGLRNDKSSDYARFLRTVHPEDRDGVAQAVHRAISGNGHYEHVHRRVLSGGQVTWIAARARVEFDPQGKPVRMRGVGIDITARKLAEEQAKKAEAEAQRLEQELEHVSRVSSLGALAGSLAHELNQPLTAILTNAEAVQLLINNEQNGAEVRDILKDIQKQAGRAGEIIAGMRRMLKKDPGQMTAQDINLAVKDVLEMMRSDLANRRITPMSRLDPLLPPVKGHGVQLRQVVLNLVMNACDAMSEIPAGRRMLTIESRRVTAQEVEVSVTDCGPGFPEALLRNVGQPFHTTKPKGLGLGLEISRTIIAMHGGRLVTANNGDIGATVRFTLPTQSETGL